SGPRGRRRGRLGGRWPRPARETGMPRIDRTMNPNADGQTLRVLIVEDCADTADSLAALVRLWGHDAAVAYRGDSALALATGRAFDVVLLDVGLPDGSGVDLAPRLR